MHAQHQTDDGHTYRLRKFVADDAVADDKECETCADAAGSLRVDSPVPVEDAAVVEQANGHTSGHGLRKKSEDHVFFLS